MVGSKCRDFKNREVSNVNAPNLATLPKTTDHGVILLENECSTK